MIIKRSCYLLITIWILLIALIFRIYYVTFGSVKEKVEMTAGSRSATRVLYNSKGLIYDRNFVALAGNQFVNYLVIDPRRFDLQQLDYICEMTSIEKNDLSQKLKKETPFVLTSYNKVKQVSGVFVFEGTGRYPYVPVAQHIVGYLDSENKVGLSGMERSYNDFLSLYSDEREYTYSTNAVRGINAQTEIVCSEAEDSLDGIVLTLDKKLSLFSESVLNKYIARGCVVIMDCNNGEILTLSSNPGYDSEKVTEYINSNNGELINNALVNQTVGSVFKTVIAAAVIESGIDEFTFDCKGAINVSGRTFTCQNSVTHGEQNLNKAFSNSCNCYFISVGQLLGYDKIKEMFQKFGLDSSIRIAKDIYSEASLFPLGDSSLNIANLSIGQGELMLSPLSITRLMAVISNGGYLVNPKLYLGTFLDGNFSNESQYSYKSKIISDSSVKKLFDMCIACVEKGTGSNAGPSIGGAGGKTASAQTGKIKNGGKEILNTYFTGFYPAETPKYVITVFAIDGESGAATCAPVFKEICDFIAQNY